MRFNKKYTVYLDVGNGYEEVFVSDIGKFTYEREDGQYFWRYKWGEVTFSNNPKSESELTDNKFKGYDLIASAGGAELPYSQEIKIKYEDSERTIEGYFSHKDCQFKSGKHFKVITVKPATLDEYTPLLENWEEKVGIIGGDIIARGNWRLRPFNYNQFSNHTLPLILTSSNIESAKDAAGDNPVTNKFIYNTTKGYILDVSVSAKAVNVSGSGTYIMYLKKYDENLTEIDSTIISQRSITDEIDECEFSGNANVTLSAGDSLAITVTIGVGSLDYKSINVSVTGNPINISTKDIKVQFNEREIKNWRRWGIEDGMGARVDIKLSERPLLEDYFENEGSPYPGKPKASMFGGERGMRDKDGLTLYQNSDGVDGLVEIYEPDDWELSEVTVYRGELFRKWFHRELKYHCICLFSREEVITKNDDNNQPVEPEDSPETWTLRKSDPDGKIGYTLWTRKPYNGAYKEWELGEPVNYGNDPYANNGYFLWSNKLTSKRKYPNLENKQMFSNAIDLYDFIKYIYNNTAYPSGDVKSTFLWNDYEEDMPVITESGQNYVTKETNPFNDTVVLPTLNLKENINTEDDDSKLELSFKDFMEDFRNLFKIIGMGNLYWFIQWNTITEQYDLRIEHIKFLDFSINVYDKVNLIEDATYKKYLEETYNYSFDDSDMFRKITIESINSGYKGFRENEVLFEKIVSNTRNNDLSFELKTKILSTDIQYAKENPNDLENGLIWLNIDSNDEVIRDKTSKNNEIEMPNGYFATSNFLDKEIMRYEGVWEEGTINRISQKSFITTLRNLTGEDFSIPNLHSAQFFNTGLGVGMTEQLELDPERQITQLKLLFRKLNAPMEIDLKSGETTNLSGFYLMVQKEDDFAGAENIYFDFGNYEN